MSNYFIYLIIMVLNAIGFIFFYDAAGVDDYSYAGMTILLFITGILLLWAGFASFQIKSPKIAFNGSDKCWSYSGNTYSFIADGEEWVIARFGTGFGAGLRFIIAMEGSDTICMRKNRVRYAASPHVFSTAWYKPETDNHLKINYPELHKKLLKKFGSVGAAWLEYKYDPVDEMNIRRDRHPILQKVLTADDIKANLLIGSKSADGKRNTLITEIVDRIDLLIKLKDNCLEQIQGIEDNIGKSASNIEILLDDFHKAGKNKRN